MSGRPRNTQKTFSPKGTASLNLPSTRPGQARRGTTPLVYTKRHPQQPRLCWRQQSARMKCAFLFPSLHSSRLLLAAKANIFHLRLRSYCCGSTALSRRAAGKRCSFAADFPPLNNTTHTTFFRTPTPSMPPILWRGQPHPHYASFRGGRKSKKPESSTASLVQPEASTRNTLMNPPVGGIFVF